MNQTLTETKHYATDYNKPIKAKKAVSFLVKNVPTERIQGAELRIGFGREKDKSRQPKVFFNGKSVQIPENHRGQEEDIRDAFFGMIEIDVPADLIEKKNQVEIIFPDEGGRVSSVTLKAFQK